MRRRALLEGGAGAGLALMLGACGGPEPPPPTILQLTASATADANADGTGFPKPLRVRILRLASTTIFQQADFFALDADPAKALGKELVGFDDLVLPPGGSLPYEAEFEPNAKLVGIMAAYYAIDRAQWRAWATVPKNATTPMTATFARSGVTLAGAAA